MASPLTLKKIRVLTVTFTVLQGLARTVSLTSSPTTLPLFYSLKPHWPPCCSPNTLLPQDLCTCYSLSLKAFSKQKQDWLIFVSQVKDLSICDSVRSRPSKSELLLVQVTKASPCVIFSIRFIIYWNSLFCLLICFSLLQLTQQLYESKDFVLWNTVSPTTKTGLSKGDCLIHLYWIIPAFPPQAH